MPQWNDQTFVYSKGILKFDGRDSITQWFSHNKQKSTHHPTRCKTKCFLPNRMKLINKFSPAVNTSSSKFKIQTIWIFHGKSIVKIKGRQKLMSHSINRWLEKIVYFSIKPTCWYGEKERKWKNTLLNILNWYTVYFRHLISALVGNLFKLFFRCRSLDCEFYGLFAFRFEVKEIKLIVGI